MSIAGYFSSTRELRMSKKPSPQGIGFEGEVLRGEKSVEEKQRHEAILATNPLDEVYKDVRDYDPVLLYHLRLPNNKISKRTEQIPSAASGCEKTNFADEPNK